MRELSSDLRSDSFNVSNVADRLAALRSDPWKGFFEPHQTLPRSNREKRPGGRKDLDKARFVERVGALDEKSDGEEER